MSSLLKPIFSRALASVFGCPMTIADVRSALASKNFAMKKMSVMIAQKYTKKSKIESKKIGKNERRT